MPLNTVKDVHDGGHFENMINQIGPRETYIFSDST